MWKSFVHKTSFRDLRIPYFYAAVYHKVKEDLHLFILCVTYAGISHTNAHLSTLSSRLVAYFVDKDRTDTTHAFI